MDEFTTLLPFEKSLESIEKQINKLREKRELDSEKTQSLQQEYKRRMVRIYRKLTPYDRILLARHIDRPHFSNYVHAFVDSFIALAGDRHFADDKALLIGFGKINDTGVVIMGHEKGRDVDERVYHNFGMARPEGYRKVVRILQLAEKYHLPVIALVDTPGAYPGRGAEERGQSEAIAKSIEAFLNIKTPTLSIIVGEGSSGGAIAIAATDEIYMLSNSTYAVISPEGAASILFKDASKAAELSSHMAFTAQDLLKFKMINGIIHEPVGGAHRNINQAFKGVKKTITEFLHKYQQIDVSTLLENRVNKFIEMGRK